MARHPIDERRPRFLQLESPLGDDLKLTEFTGVEELSRPFRFHLELLSEDEQVDPYAILGKNVTFEMEVANDESRSFNGFVSQFSRGAEGADGRRHYNAEVVPWLWFLTRASDCRIFQDQDVRQIVKTVFEDLGYQENTHFTLGDVKGDLRRREYCVQYRETAANFVHRLLEEEGIYYYFRHEAGKHVMVLGNDHRAFKPCGIRDVFFPRTIGPSGDESHLTSWGRSHRYRSGKWTLNDFNFEQPRTSLLTAPQPTTVPAANVDKFELYDCPGNYNSTDQGNPLTRIRMEEEELRHEEVAGSSTYRWLAPGQTIKVDSHIENEESDREYLVRSVHHSVTARYHGRSSRTGGEKYGNSFRCFPTDMYFRPPRTTPKPSVQGMQTAWVVGPNDATEKEQTEKIHTDRHGRVKVQFHWDRKGQLDDRSSCWIRVAQVAAGRGWGAHFWPRVGHEVVVSFLEGDPDRPLIVGSVYNAINTPPYALPEHQSRSGIKTRSTPNGSADHFNEIRLEDKKDHEQVYIHAERNMDVVVENDDTATIHGNRRETVRKLKKVEVSGGREVSIEGDLESYPFPVADGLTVDGTRHAVIEGDDIADVKGQRSVNSEGRHDISSSEQIRLMVGGSMITIDAMGISLSAGANSIKIDPAGVWIDALNVGIKGQMLASMHAPVVSMTADGTTTVNAPLTNILSTGPLILKGAMAGMTF